MTTKAEYLKAKEIVDNYTMERPLPITPISTKNLVGICEKIMDEVAEHGYFKEFEACVFNSAMVTIDGDEIWKWWNENHE